MVVEVQEANVGIDGDMDALCLFAHVDATGK